MVKACSMPHHTVVSLSSPCVKARETVPLAPASSPKVPAEAGVLTSCCILNKQAAKFDYVQMK